MRAAEQAGASAARGILGETEAEDAANQLRAAARSLAPLAGGPAPVGAPAGSGPRDRPPAGAAPAPDGRQVTATGPALGPGMRQAAAARGDGGSAGRDVRVSRRQHVPRAAEPKLIVDPEFDGRVSRVQGRPAPVNRPRG